MSLSSIVAFVMALLVVLSAPAAAREPTTRRLPGGRWRLDIPKRSLEKLLQERFVGQTFDGAKLRNLSLTLSAGHLELNGVVRWGLANIDVEASAEPSVRNNKLYASYRAKGKGFVGRRLLNKSGKEHDLLRHVALITNKHAAGIPNGKQVLTLLQAMYKGSCTLDGVFVNEHGLQLDCAEVAKLDL